MFRTLAAARALRALRARIAGFARRNGRDVPGGAVTPDLMALLGHELRTPLSALMGYTEMLAGAETLTDAQRRAWSASAHEAAAHLNALIAAALEQGVDGLGAPAAGRAAVDLNALAGACCDMARPDAAGRGVDIRYLPQPQRLDACCDPRAARQILLNLIANAIKFTPPGGEVRVWAERDDGFIALTVADNGIGLEASRQRRAAAGLGLGLTIVRSLASLQGGALVIRPGDDAGTVARVTLPEAVAGFSEPAGAAPGGATQMMAPCLA
ncbi:sensor histidine kinase [Camelimonas abortus]|uniref:histidine kinase n=1 Tax=Camelimonas abortus TaxID=1017184 RepID=A0ABV7LBK7_9HYPH